MALVCRILHMSDLHYGYLENPKDFYHGFDKKGKKSLVSHCIKALEKHLNDDIPLVVVMSGDFVCDGNKQDQYEEAYRNIVRLKDGLFKNKITNHEQESRFLIVPGNHDLSRTAKENKRLNFYVSLIHNKCYPSIKHLRMQKNLDDAKRYLKGNPYSWVHTIELKSDISKRYKQNLKIAFALFVSPLTTEETLLKGFDEKLKKYYQVFSNPWELDRGLITDEQLDNIESRIKRKDEKNILNDATHCLKIALFHHNPLPICRIDKGKRADAFYLPEKALLANGTEVLYRLSQMGFQLVLHGHRHQNAISTTFPQKRSESPLLVVAAPSAGLSDDALMNRYGVDKKRNHPTKWQGFNLLEIHHTEYGYHTKLLPYFFEEDKFEYDDKRKIEFKLYPEPLLPFGPLCDSSGLHSATELLAISRKGTTSLHYTYTGYWDNESDEAIRLRSKSNNKRYQRYSPLEMLWKEVLTDKNVRKDFLEMFNDSDDISNRMKSNIRRNIKQSVSNGYITNALKNSLKGFGNKISWQDIVGEKEVEHRNKYLKMLSQISHINGRWGNYSIEILKLILSKEYKLHRCIYFWPSIKNDDRIKVNSKELIKYTQDKFKWFLLSLLSYRGLTGVNISWLPMAIEGCENQTILCMSSPIDKEQPNILLGFGGVNLTGEDRISVFKAAAEQPRNTLGTGVGKNIRGIISHAVHPLAKRLQGSFPLMIDGKIILENIDKLSLVLGINTKLKGLIKFFKQEVKKKNSFYCIEDKNELLECFRAGKTWEERLQDLHNWKDWYGIEGPIPWSDLDFNYLKNELHRREL